MPPNSPDSDIISTKSVGGKTDQADQRGEDAGKGETESRDRGMTAGARCQHAADEHTDRAHRKRAGQRHIRQRVGRSVKCGERDDEEVVEAPDQRNQDEKAEVKKNGRREQEPPAGVVGGVGPARDGRPALFGQPVSGRRSSCAISNASTTKPRIAAPT